jgi:glucoamylase
MYVFKLFTISLLLCISINANSASPFNQTEIKTLRQLFLANFNSNGSVYASPSQKNPNYYYHWVRDAAIAFSMVCNDYKRYQDPNTFKLIDTYIHWINQLQQNTAANPGFDIQGEPKFNLDGSVYQKPWGRPQNDGPALRALALIGFANTLITSNDSDYVRRYLYQPTLEHASMGVIKIDLEYIAHHWQDESFDLWEEVKGKHFFTQMVQRKALLEGVILASKLGDNLAAAYYQKQVNDLTQALDSYYDYKTQIIQATVGDKVHHLLDTSVINAILINDNDSWYALDDYRVLNTVTALTETFKNEYPINHNKSNAILFGRYANDSYDGTSTNGKGNPWYILTATMARYYYGLADKLEKKNHIDIDRYTFDFYQRIDKNISYGRITDESPQFKHIINTLKQQGDDTLKRIKYFSLKNNLHLHEQINRTSGNGQGAHDLTWSYQALLDAIAAS